MTTIFSPFLCTRCVHYSSKHHKDEACSERSVWGTPEDLVCQEAHLPGGFFLEEPVFDYISSAVDLCDGFSSWASCLSEGDMLSVGAQLPRMTSSRICVLRPQTTYCSMLYKTTRAGLACSCWRSLEFILCRAWRENRTSI